MPRGEKRDTTLWMEVSDDKYELPLCVFDTTRELAAFSGQKRPSNILSSITHAKDRPGCRCRYVRVELSRDEFDWCHN